MCTRRPYWLSAPLAACVKTTPGFGPLLPQVRFSGRSRGNCWTREIKPSCGNAQVSGAQMIAWTPASRNCCATMSAPRSSSTSTGLQTTRAGPPPGIFTSAATASATMPTMLRDRLRAASSTRGSHVAKTPNVIGARAGAFVS